MFKNIPFSLSKCLHFIFCYVKFVTILIAYFKFFENLEVVNIYDYKFVRVFLERHKRYLIVEI